MGKFVLHISKITSNGIPKGVKAYFLQKYNENMAWEEKRA